MAFTKQVPGTASLVDQVTALKARVASVERRKNDNLARLDVYKQQYRDVLARLKALGIESPNDLQPAIDAKEQELRTLLAQFESDLTTAESVLDANASV